MPFRPSGLFLRPASLEILRFSSRALLSCPATLRTLALPLWPPPSRASALFWLAPLLSRLAPTLLASISRRQQLSADERPDGSPNLPLIPQGLHSSTPSEHSTSTTRLPIFDLSIFGGTNSDSSTATAHSSGLKRSFCFQFQLLSSFQRYSDIATAKSSLELL